MQSQVKTLRVLALVIITLTLKMTQASELGWSALTTDKMKILEVSSAQGEVISSPVPFFKEIGYFFWGWDPKKELKKTSDGPNLEPTGHLTELMRNLFVEFDLSDVAHFRKLWFQPTPTNRFRGLLGIHDFTKRRPFILFRMGIYGNVDEVMAERYLLKLMYEDLDANFLLLESSTSHGFLSSNEVISFGGVEEGLQTFLVLNEITHSPLSSIIGNIHLFGLSLGGQGTFVTALLDQFNGGKIKSVLAFCPLINLKETFDYHARPGFGNAMVDLWSSERLRSLSKRYRDDPEIQGHWKSIFDFKPRYTSAAMAHLNQDRKTPLISVDEMNSLIKNMKWPKGFDTHLRGARNFYDMADFWPYYQGVKTPVTIFVTPNDPLVVNELNSEMIFSGKHTGDFSSLKYERLDRGIHCGLPSVYRWDYVESLVKKGFGIN